MNPEDKRIRKTKKFLKQSLIDLLENKPFDQITVTELCRQADISRITFYSHYDDKYALVDDISCDMLEIARDDFHRMQKENNPEGDPTASYCNLLDCILNLYGDKKHFFRHTIPSENPYLYYTFYQHISENIEHRIEKESHLLQPKYSYKKVSAFLCNGIWGFINESYEENASLEDIRQETRELLKNLLTSGVLMKVEK